MTTDVIDPPVNHAREKKELTEVKQMQHEAYRRAFDEELPGKERRAWMLCYEKLSERKRILQGKPLPGSYSHEKVKAGRAQRMLGGGSMLLDLAQGESVHVQDVQADPAHQ